MHFMYGTKRLWASEPGTPASMPFAWRSPGSPPSLSLSGRSASGCAGHISDSARQSASDPEVCQTWSIHSGRALSEEASDISLGSVENGYCPPL